jgi:hypothetical protein
MGFFSQRPKVRLDDFCREFYDTHCLHPPEVAGINLALTYCETIKRSITEVDPRFADVDIQLLMAELTVIHFEVFGLAWLHQKGDKRAAEQSDFTRRYLDEAGRTDIWEAMQPYNGAIGRSSTLGQTSETATGRGYLAFVNRVRADLFDAWLELGFDGVSAANRVATDEAWKKGLTAGFLMLTLCESLGCEVNEEAQFRLVAIIRGLYDGVVESLKAVKIVE